MGKFTLLQLLRLHKGIYPWDQALFEKGLFYEEILIFFDDKMAVLWGIFEDVDFGHLRDDFWDFSFETEKGLDCCRCGVGSLYWFGVELRGIPSLTFSTQG